MTIRVGIADDDSEVRAALIDVVDMDTDLELVGAAGDADGAVVVAREHNPDVFLVDVRMPGGGPRAAREIRMVSPHTRVVAFSAHEDRSTVLEMLRSGAVAYVTKGGGVADILSAINRAMAGHSTLSPGVSAEVVSELTLRLRHQENLDQRRRQSVERIEEVLRTPGAFHVVYQPIFDLRSGEVVGAEALSRFTLPPPHPPDEWFRDAAEVGLGTVLEAAAASTALAGLEELPFHAYMAINMSPATILDPMFVGLFADAPVDRVVLEVTEHAQVEDYDLLGAALRPFRERGLRLAVDDAGSGYAGLRHILRLAPDLVKLDIELTRGIERDRARRALAEALITFAEAMDLVIVAEGIETAEELEALRALGVPSGQGYFLARPGPLPLATGVAASP
jgi:EAL domain-containing protein (putative c-di-GMP-specific phosphodiesterase class I)/AmiR/NasT family two-component response regulator